MSQQALQEEETLEGMGLRDILVLLQSISYAKADHIEQNWQDYELAREWKIVGNRLGQWAKTRTTLH